MVSSQERTSFIETPSHSSIRRSLPKVCLSAFTVSTLIASFLPIFSYWVTQACSVLLDHKTMRYKNKFFLQQTFQNQASLFCKPYFVTSFFEWIIPLINQIFAADNFLLVKKLSGNTKIFWFSMGTSSILNNGWEHQNLLEESEISTWNSWGFD